jgi:dCMP deaminase
MTRPTWIEHFSDAARLAAKRSTCVRRQVGAVIVKDNHILSTGYNGAASGMPHCAELGCIRQEQGIPSGQRHELCRGVHAEQNAIIQAAYHGTSIKDSEMYITHFPCFICAKMIRNAGIIRVNYLEGYPDDMANEIFQDGKITARMLK